MEESEACFATSVASRCPSSRQGRTRMTASCSQARLTPFPSDRPDHKEVGQHLCSLMYGYAANPCAREIAERGYVAHVRPRNVESAGVERESLVQGPGDGWSSDFTHSSRVRFRKLLVSFEKTERAYLGLLNLACALISWRQVICYSRIGSP